MPMPHRTSLSSLSDHDWNIIKNRWARGVDWYVEKIGRRWAITLPRFEKVSPFRTRKAAYEYASNLICQESAYRAAKEYGLLTYN